jgi:hypothetical protein
MKKYLFVFLSIAFVVGLVAVRPVLAQSTSTCGQWDIVALLNNTYIYQQDEWNSTLSQCASVGPNAQFTVTTANFNMPNGSPATYPSLYQGCHPFGGQSPNQGICTTGSNMPIVVSNITSATTSVSGTVGSGDYDYAYDIWFTTNGSTQGSPTGGTEIMIWLNHSGFPSPFGSQIGAVTLDGAGWNVWGGNQDWKTISYVRQSGVSSVTNLDLLPIFKDAVSRGYLSNSYYLMDVETGFEIWTGGQGKAISSYSVSIVGSGSGATSTPTRTFTPPPGNTPTRTRTPTTGPSLTPTRTPTTGGPTPTPSAGASRTPTQGVATATSTTPPGGTCSPVTATITAPFTKDGAGAFCWQSSNLGAYINSWNLTSLTVNGVNETNLYVAAGSLPAKINGYWYVSYNSAVAWGHFEAK